MKSTARTIAVSSLVLGLLMLAFTGCDPVVDVSGTVRDKTGAPLEGVLVTLTSENRVPDSVTTGRDGSFVVGLVGADPLKTRISFRKEGYTLWERPVGKEERVVMEITLLPESS